MTDFPARVTPVFGGLELIVQYAEVDIITRALGLYSDSMRNTGDMFAAGSAGRVAQACFARARTAERMEYAMTNPTETFVPPDVARTGDNIARGLRRASPQSEEEGRIDNP